MVKNMYNENCLDYYSYNFPDIDDKDTLVLTNGELYCLRSNKVIHQFPHLNHRISGIFSASFQDVVMHTEIYDLRTLKMREQIPHFQDILLRRTHDDNFLIGRNF
ncbi:Protein VPRBP [Thelohanellus kitauei]|uniref:Protein VPRBP n=1 Tax=Thelohanellus kitauei TaxID=669202 RepID=A0A0C2MCK8_THEKT|nr:Protein VPRBP [Thelohanellus kitauei]